LDKPFLISLLLTYPLAWYSYRASQGISAAPYFYVKKQLVTVGLGLIAAILILRYDYSQLRRYKQDTIWLVHSSSVAVQYWLWEKEVRGTTGWIDLGPLPAVQPAEFYQNNASLAFADFLNNRRGMLNTFAEMLPCFIYMGIPFLLIMMQPDLGTALVYIALTVVMMFAAGANPRFWEVFWQQGVSAIGLLLFMHFQTGCGSPLEDYQIRRLTVFINPYEDGQGGRGAGWNTIQSLIAIGRGDSLGKGLYNGTGAVNFLPEHHTDFIYAVIGEELGFWVQQDHYLVWDITAACHLYQLPAKDFFLGRW
jgi:rod shape determining protein RodA